MLMHRDQQSEHAERVLEGQLGSAERSSQVISRLGPPQAVVASRASDTSVCAHDLLAAVLLGTADCHPLPLILRSVSGRCGV